MSRKVLFRAALLLLVIYVVIPGIFGSVFRRASYLPQLIEAHKLRLYYTVYSTLIPFKCASQSSIERDIFKAAQRHALEPALVKAVVRVESGFDQFSLSPTGACGLMQLLPSTYYSLRWGNPFGSKANLLAGTEYLSRLYSKYGGDLRLTLAAYNAGPSNVKRYKEIPPFAETQNYVTEVLRFYEMYSD